MTERIPAPPGIVPGQQLSDTILRIDTLLAPVEYILAGPCGPLADDVPTIEGLRCAVESAREVARYAAEIAELSSRALTRDGALIVELEG